MKAAIDNFARAEGDNKFLLLGAMAELGEESISGTRKSHQGISRHQWKAVLLVGGDFLSIKHPFLSFATADDAGSWLKDQNIQDAYLLVKGSRSMQMEKVLNYI
jgi:UDP-N-acetylmuramoyl-tripeptide--D-alanyl-D-alanine ligase